jgi:choline dehydrogenase-like flavoprotein
MRRRTFFNWFASLAAVLPVAAVRSRAQTTTFPGGQNDALGALASAVLPAEPGAAGITGTAAAESATGHEPRLRGADRRILLGDALLVDWRERSRRGTARVRGYYDVHPDRDSSLTLDDSARNRWGDPLPRIDHRLDAATLTRATLTRSHFQQLFEEMAQAGNGKILNTAASNYLDHPAGGCRMGGHAASSVCDSFGQTHDHENLFVTGSPTLPNAGCTNDTLTFVALALRSAGQIAARFPNKVPQ